MERRRLIAGAVAALALAAVLWPRKKVSPEAQIRQLIAACVAGVEARDLSPIDEALAADFRGGGLDRRELKQLLAGHLFRNAHGLVVFNPQLSVEVTGTRATFSGVFVLARGRDVDWQQPGDGVSRYDIEGTLELRDGAWKVTTAEWRR